MAALPGCRNRQFHAFGWKLPKLATRTDVIPGLTRDPAFLEELRKGSVTPDLLRGPAAFAYILKIAGSRVKARDDMGCDGERE